MTEQDDSVDIGPESLIASLIEQSSLGSESAREARASVSADEAAALRSRLVLDRPNGPWTTAPISSEVGRLLKVVMPDRDGLVATPPVVPVDGTLVAANDAGECQVLGQGSIVLPGRAARQQWRLLWFPRSEFRWRASFAPDDVSLDALASHAVRVFDAIVLWSIRDACLTARAKVLDLDSDLHPRLASVANRLTRSVHAWDDLVWRTAFAAALRREFLAVGLDADVVVQPRLSSKVAFSAGAQRVLDAMSAVAVYNDWRDLLDPSGPLYPRIREMLEDLGAGAFVRQHFAQIFETQRILGLSTDAAGDVTIEAFARLFFTWDVAREADRLPLLATAAIQAMRDLGFEREANALEHSGQVTDFPTPLPRWHDVAEALTVREAEDPPPGRRLDPKDLQEARYDYLEVPLG